MGVDTKNNVNLAAIKQKAAEAAAAKNNPLSQLAR
jgi:hypothetical protein